MSNESLHEGIDFVDESRRQVPLKISTIALYVAYGIPIFLNARNRRRRSGELVTPELAAWHLGRWSRAVNAIAMIWIVFITLVFMLPPNELALWTMCAFCVSLTAYWWLFARRHFRGPETPGAGIP